MKLLSKLKNLDSLTAFLILEVLAVTSFSLGSINAVFYSVGVVVSIFAIFQSYNKFEKDEFKSLLIFFVPMLLLSFFVSFGNLFKGQTLLNILVLLGINSFFIMGIVSNKIKSFNKETCLIVIGVSMALLVVISMIYSWANYGLFYAVIYKDTPIYYYDAMKYDITKETGWLMGFSIKEMSILFTGGYGVILSSYLGALLFINPKKDLRKFLIYLSIGLVGLIYLISIPNLWALLFIVPIIVFALCYRFLKDNKIFVKAAKIALLVIFSLLVVFFLLMIINNVNASFSEFISSNALLNRLFNGNRIVDGVNKVLRQAFYPYNLFGFIDSSLYYETQQVILINTKMFEIELIKESGFFAFLILLIMVPLYVIFAFKYLKKSEDSSVIKVLSIGILLTYFIYSTFENDITPIVHETSNYMSFYRSPLSMVVLFILGTIYVPIFNKKEEKQNEK